MQKPSDAAGSTGESNREPWLAVSLSWLRPGLGQMYCGSWIIGAVMFVLLVLLDAASIGFLLIPQVPTAALIALWLASGAMHIAALVAAHRVARKRNDPAFEERRTKDRDPWLAVFLNLIVPGIGHLYLRKWLAGVVIVGLFLAAPRISWGYLACSALLVFAPLHAYFTSRQRRPEPRYAWGWIVTIAVCGPVLSGVSAEWVKSYVSETYRSDGNSMAPTLRRGMYVVSNKLTYRQHEPEAGDIVAFTPPEYPSVYDSGSYVMRIVALAGQTVEVRDGVAWIDGQCAEPDNLPDHTATTGVELPPEALSRYFNYGVVEPYVVPEGCYFILGDNRDNSVDCRYFGAVPRENIIGKVVRVIWPINAPPLYGDR